MKPEVEVRVGGNGYGCLKCRCVEGGVDDSSGDSRVERVYTGKGGGICILPGVDSIFSCDSELGFGLDSQYLRYESDRIRSAR